MREVIIDEGQGCTVSIGWKRLSEVREKLYGKHTIGEVTRSEGQGCTVRMGDVLGVRVKAVR
jgi:hypothetical protein